MAELARFPRDSKFARACDAARLRARKACRSTSRAPSQAWTGRPASQARVLPGTSHHMLPAGVAELSVEEANELAHVFGKNRELSAQRLS
jgi:hypothetical protein